MPDSPEKSSPPDGKAKAHLAADLLRRVGTRIVRRKNAFTREKFFDAIKTLAWIGPLTILIWVYAEREQVNPKFTVNDVPIDITSNDLFVEPTGINPPKVSLTFTGPQAGLEKVRDRLLNGIPRGISIDVANSLNQGDNQPVNVMDRIQNLSWFKENGVSVIDANPAQIAVTVDRFAERELEVESPASVTNLNRATTHYDPRRVKARGPASVLQLFADQGSLHATADIAGNEILKSPGLHDPFSVAVRLPVRDERVTFAPSSVKAYLDVRPAEVTETLPSLPVWIEASPAFLESNKVVFGAGESTITITDVNVTGPQSQIDLLKNRSFERWAVLVVKAADAQVTQQQQRTLEYHLPDGVVPTPEQKAREVTFQVKKRDSAD